MTTNTTNSPDIHDLLSDLFEAGFNSPGIYESTADYRKARDAILAHIDAKLAQARQEGFLAGGQHQHEVEKERIAIETKWATDMQAKAVALTDRLAEIQRDVEGLKAWLVNSGYQGVDIEAVSRDAVLAMLQPQGQADTSGLPG